jgi:NTP-dependent ternary conflict system VMAP-like protein
LTDRRHALIIATQCPSQGVLPHLDEAARALAAVLTDEAIGVCSPGLPDGRVIVAEQTLTGDEITTTVREAIRHAATHRATLILAFLGHGTIPGDDPTLYYMAPDSLPEDRSRAVNVPVLITEAVDASGVDGVIAVLDTCNAAGAAVSSSQVLTGVRAGRVRYELLMASAVKQDAHHLILSRTLSELLRRGLAGEPARLSASDLLGTLRARITGQDTPYDRRDGDDGAGEPLWLAHNVRAAPAGSMNWNVLSGTAGLGDLLVGAGLPGDLALLPGLPGLREMQRRLDGTGDAGRQARAVVDGLVLAYRTAVFLNASMPGALSTTSFQRAVRLAGIVDDEAIPMSDEYSLLAHIATRHPTVEADGRAQVARFVAALAAGQPAPDWPAAEDWATSVRARAPFNEARAWLRSRSAGQRLRLAISLHQTDPGALWPRAVTAWLYDEAGRVDEKLEVACTDDQDGVEEAVGRLVDWGTGAAERAGATLEHIDFALPTGLLAGDWQPEALEYHVRLGEEFLVTVRWADRLLPSTAMSRSIKRAAKLLVEITRSTHVPPVDWLEPDDLRDSARLRERFVGGRLRQAVGLACRPRDSLEVLAMVLHYSPVVLWPHTVPELTAEGRACLAGTWERLPEAFPDLYRRLHHGEDTDDTAHLRAIWDDSRWLSFCQRFQYAP